MPFADENRSVLFKYWGKTSKCEVECEASALCHLLIYHCLDVAVVAEAWWGKSAPLRRAFVRTCGTDADKTVKAWVLFFVAMHDLGKWDVRFQLKAREIALRLNALFSEADEGRSKGFNHGDMGLNWFIREEETYGLIDCFPWMQAVAGHHGRLSPGDAISKPLASPEVVACDHAARHTFVEALRNLFLFVDEIDQGELPPSSPPLLAGFCSVCDWLGSNSDFGFYYKDVPEDLNVYLDSRREAAERALRNVGLWRPCLVQGGMEVLYPDLDPRGIQQLVHLLPLEPGLILVEGPTGSGKTETAISYASRLLADGLADSIIFALPTQATANAMLKRLDDIAGRLFSGGGNLVLAHGKARFNCDFERLKKRAAAPNPQLEEEALVQCAQWLASSRKRVFLGQIGVCTIDQVLLSVLPVRHNFVRSFGVGKSVLIVDEVHAYDSYMNGLLDCVLEKQRESGGSAVLLSATLPGKRRREIAAIWNSSSVVLKAGTDPYPMVTYVNRESSRSWEPLEPAGSFGVAIEEIPAQALYPPDELLDRIIDAARSGARVALICNLVADAQEAARRMASSASSSGIPMDLFHSRFRFLDRQEIEMRILECYGKSAPAGVGRILVATQVVEQSLDLDFDWMITQLCPVDLLFQRLGRLHRHNRPRPSGFEHPQCSVIVPPSYDYDKHLFIYGDARVLWRTQALLDRNFRVTFPSAYREWIEAVYADDEAWPDEPEHVSKAHERFQIDQMGNRYKAKQLVYSLVNPFSDTDDKVRSLTRDGEMSLNVIPFIKIDGERRFIDGGMLDSLDEWERDEQVNLNGIPVPAGWKHRLPARDPDGNFHLHMEQASKGFKAFYSAEVTYLYDTFFGLERNIDEPAD